MRRTPLPYPNISPIPDNEPDAAPELWNERFAEIDANFNALVGSFGQRFSQTIRKAIDFSNIFGCNRVEFEFFNDVFNLHDKPKQPAIVISGVKGDDSLDLVDTNDITEGADMILYDETEEFPVKITRVLTRHRIRIAQNLSKHWSANARLRGVSNFDYTDNGIRLTPNQGAYISRVLNMGTDAPKLSLEVTSKITNEFKTKIEAQYLGDCTGKGQGDGTGKGESKQVVHAVDLDAGKRVLIVRRENNAARLKISIKDQKRADWTPIAAPAKILTENAALRVPFDVVDEHYTFEFIGDGQLKIEALSEPVELHHFALFDRCAASHRYTLNISHELENAIKTVVRSELKVKKKPSGGGGSVEGGGGSVEGGGGSAEGGGGSAEGGGGSVEGGGGFSPNNPNAWLFDIGRAETREWVAPKNGRYFIVLVGGGQAGALINENPAQCGGSGGASGFVNAGVLNLEQGARASFFVGPGGIGNRAKGGDTTATINGVQYIAWGGGTIGDKGNHNKGGDSSGFSGMPHGKLDWQGGSSAGGSGGVVRGRLANECGGGSGGNRERGFPKSTFNHGGDSRARLWIGSGSFASGSGWIENSSGNYSDSTPAELLALGFVNGGGGETTHSPLVEGQPTYTTESKKVGRGDSDSVRDVEVETDYMYLGGGGGGFLDFDNGVHFDSSEHWYPHQNQKFAGKKGRGYGGGGGANQSGVAGLFAILYLGN